MRFSWVPEDQMEEFRSFFRTHGLLAEESVAQTFRRPALQA